MDDCGCKARKAKLNSVIPGLGDKVEILLSPIAPIVQPYLKGYEMPSILKPDMKSVVWLAIGALVVPFILTKIR